MNSGIFCISIDIELLWGRHDLSNYKDFITLTTKERAAIKKLLSLLEKYGIRATWAIVGHLFLDKCSLENGKNHPDIIRPEPQWVKGDWFQNDPRGDIKKNPNWYGADIVKLIQGNGDQEIGSHSFSHVIFSDKGTSKECVKSEIEKSIRLAKSFGINLNSFVFPRNSIGFIEILKEYDFKCFRGKDPNFSPQKNLASLIQNNLFLFTNKIPATPKPKKESGLVNIPASMYFVSNRGVRRYIPGGIRLKKATMGIDHAIKTKGVFHLWTHPADLVDNGDKMIREFEQILEYVSLKMKENKLNNKTMGEIAANFV